MEMFDEEITTLIKAEGTVEEKNWLAEHALQAEEAEAAVADLIRSWRRFKEMDASVAATSGAQLGIEWWRAAENLMLANNRLKDLFCGRDRSPRSIRLCHEYKLTLISDKKRLRADA
jgi:hypothetical protein